MNRSLTVVALVAVVSIGSGCTALPNLDPNASESQASGCPSNKLQGELRAIGERLVLDAGGEGPIDKIIHWPAGYDVRGEADILVVVDSLGLVAARQGDEVVLYGEESSLPGNAWVVCRFEVVTLGPR